MSRSTKLSKSPSPFGGDIYDASPSPTRRRIAQRTVNANAPPAISPSPSISISSDKENRWSRTVDKRKDREPMGPPSAPSAASDSNKKRRTVERVESPARSRRKRMIEVDEDDERIADYDPDQDIEERRRLRKGLRDLNKNLIENRTESLNPNSTVLKDTLREADSYAEQIKQTSDATIDSRLLVTTADLSYKKTIALISGDTSQVVDVDEFISKCMSYMRRAEGAKEEPGPRVAKQAPSSTQRGRGRRVNGGEEDGEEDDGDMLNWEHLGRFACLPNNSRPSVPGFLLGPLSMEKRAKRVVVRKAQLRPNTLQETRPEVLEASDIHKAENANLTTLCTQISTRLRNVLHNAMDAVDEQNHDGMTAEETEELMDRYGVSAEGGLALFKFVINPYSFGQTIENIFYVSFLIRDGKAGLSTDERGMPYITPTTPRTPQERAESGDQRCQSVIALDMNQWEELIELFDIQTPMIKHREEEEHENVGAQGWYA